MVYSPAERLIDRVDIELPAGATVADALAASGLLARHPGLAAAGQRMGVWGRPCGSDEPLRDGDRVELYRPLKVDPKEARRLRQRRQGGGKPPR